LSDATKRKRGRGRGTPELRGKTHEVRLWLLANPGEYLAFDDLMLKFSISREQAHWICQALRDEGTAKSSWLVFLNPERLRAA
jgi:hypothetical protein